MAVFYVYILESLRDGTLYTGQTTNLHDRLQRHNTGSVKSTRSKGPYQVAYVETHSTRSKAMWREWELKKKYNTERKKRLIKGFNKDTIATMGL